LATEVQMTRLRPYFPKSRGRPWVDDRRILSGIILINRNGLRWRDASAAYGPPKTLYNRWKRWSDRGVFARIMTGLAAEVPDNKTISIDATYPLPALVHFQCTVRQWAIAACSDERDKAHPLPGNACLHAGEGHRIQLGAQKSGCGRLIHCPAGYCAAMSYEADRSRAA